MVTYTRIYKSRPCVKCGETIDSPKGPQRFCEPCRSTCSVAGCTNAVRAGGLCTTHYKPKYEVASLVPIDGKCGVEGCGRELKQQGMCSLHHGRAYHTGSVGAAQPTQRVATGGTCMAEGCGKPARGRGYCITHYRRITTGKEVGTGELLRARQGEGSITETGYRKIKVGLKQEFEHRVIMAAKLGRPLREGENVHHKDGNRLNNDPGNLELWITQQPAGQRVQDRIDAAIALLAEYGAMRKVTLSNDAFLYSAAMAI